MTEKQYRFKEFMVIQKEPLTVKEIAHGSGESQSYVRLMIKRFVERGAVEIVVNSCQPARFIWKPKLPAPQGGGEK